MGPRHEWRGNYKDMGANESRWKLQWGRATNGAEMFRAFLEYFLQGELQWGRATNGAEIPDGTPIPGQ